MLRKVHLTLDLIAHWWHRLTSSRYVLMLEARVRQLEADNLALRDTIFGIRGLPPIPRGEIQRFTAVPSSQPAAANEAPGTNAIRPAVEAVRRQTLWSRDRSKEAETDKKLSQASAEQVKQAAEAYKAQIRLEREQEQGKGFAVTKAGAEPVVVEEDMVDAHD